MGVAGLMAKRKAAQQPKVTEPETVIEPIRKNVISIRGTEQWRDWLIEYAAFRRVPVTSLIDQVLNEAAKRDGFTLPPER
jgi:hypothetical protein